jgi:hypothetical protein
MTKNMINPLLKIVEDIPMSLTVVLDQQSRGTIQPPPNQAAAWVCLPLRLTLLQAPGNKLLSSAEKKQYFFFTPLETHLIETYATANHLSKEAALIALLTRSLRGHAYLKAITRTRQARREAAKDTKVKIDVELIGPIEWHEKLSDDPTA